MKSQIEYRKGRLCIEDVPASVLAERFGTPLYVYSKNQITKNIGSLLKAFAVIPNSRILYALKANSNVEILKHIRSTGVGADTVSAGEIFLALKCGFPPISISFAGVGKCDTDIDYALERKIGTIIIESVEELKVVSKRAANLGQTARVTFRVNPDVDAHTHPHISTGLKENKFGIPIEKARDVIRLARTLKNVDFLGLHCHIGSQITEVAPFEEAADSLRKLVMELKRESIRVRQIDLGGGIGVRYVNAIRHKLLPEEGKKAHSINLNDLAKVIKKKLVFPNCELVMEPGRFIVAESGLLLTRVLYRKRISERGFVVVDAGMNDMMRHALYSAYHQIVPVEIQRRKRQTVDVVGPICESTDVFAIQRSMPETKRGDLLAIMTTGAYGYSISSNYNSRPRPAEVFVDGDSARVIRDRETLDDLT